ncbi:hypothetical protein CPB84DRAFT_1842350 [Gymnopilus junonius]|uniref:Uncharacterized protein n=1 Tax=Gymnopilus junonius TaxID=109634 RepID=A0A9P5P0J7_GYMJU|nr:hypothetical protein CPB84DRAFT_1842350 [Gymnopilus junonius]
MDLKYNDDDMPLSWEEINALKQAESGAKGSCASTSLPPAFASNSTPSHGRGRCSDTPSHLPTVMPSKSRKTRCYRFLNAGFSATNDHALHQDRTGSSTADDPFCSWSVNPPSHSLHLPSEMEWCLQSIDRDAGAIAQPAGQHLPYHPFYAYPPTRPHGQMNLQAMGPPSHQQVMAQFHPQSMAPPFHYPHYVGPPLQSMQHPEMQLYPQSGGGF